MKRFLIAGFLLAFYSSSAQQPSKSTGSKKGFGVTVVQTQPEFPGGPDSLQNFLQNNLKYPQDARLSRIQGRVYVGFKVAYTGKIADAKVINGVNPLLDQEALRLIGLMPDWKPGTAGGSPVDVQYVLPVDFILPSDIRE